MTDNVSAEAPAPDLITRMRNGEPCMDPSDVRCRVRDARSGCLCAEAAAEIARLTAEVERLRAELRTAADMNTVYEGRLQEKETEVERLRAALETIADGNITGSRQFSTWHDKYLACRRMARAALEEPRT